VVTACTSLWLAELFRINLAGEFGRGLAGSGAMCPRSYKRCLNLRTTRGSLLRQAGRRL
jgi:hypothetical protein